MNAKKIRILTAIVLVIATALSFNLVAFAEPDDDFIIDSPPSQNETMEYEETDEPESTTKDEPTTSSKEPTRNNNGGSNSGGSNNSGSGSNGGSNTTVTENDSFTIKLELNNGEDSITAEVNEDGFVTIPEAPKKEGFKFDGWYADNEFKTKWDFLSSVANEDTVLYAKWEENVEDTLFLVDVSSSLGGNIKVKPSKAKPGEKVQIIIEAAEGHKLVEGSISVNGDFIDGTSFIMPSENVMIEAQFELVTADDEKKDKEEEQKNLGKIITILAIAIVAIVLLVILIINRRRFAEEPEEEELFFVEPLSGQPAIRHDDFVRIKRAQQSNSSQDDYLNELAAQDDEIGIINEDEIRKIDKTGNINLDV